MAACEMVLIRLAHLADLPSPGDLVKQLTENAPPAAPARRRHQVAEAGGTAGPPSAAAAGDMAPPLGAAETAVAAEKPSAPAAPDPVSAEPPGSRHPASRRWRQPCRRRPQPRDFDDIIALCSAHREARLLAYLSDYVRPVALAEGQLTIEVLPGAPSDLAANLAAALRQWTGTVWAVDLAVGGGPTRSEARQAARGGRSRGGARPTVQAVLAAFPGPKSSPSKTYVRPPARYRRPMEDDNDSEDHDFIAEDPSAGTGF